MTLLEKDIERYVRRQVGLRGGFCLKWVCPGWAGVPDRLCLLPGGRVYFVELKRPGGELAARQKWWAEKLQALGLNYRQVWSQQAAKAFIDELKGEKE